MNLLLRRSQQHGLFSIIPLRIGFGPIFQLRVQIELNEEEKALVWKYRLGTALLVAGSRWAALRRAALSALIVGAIAYLAFFAFTSFRYGIGNMDLFLIFYMTEALPLPALFAAIMLVVYYLNEREHVTVDQLLSGGRTFYCDSVVELIQKEAYLERISEYLRQVLESAKHWHDREVIDIKPLDKAAAKQAVLAGA